MSLKPIHLTPNHPPIMVRARPELSRDFDCKVMWRKASIKMPSAMLDKISMAASRQKQKTAEWLRQAAIEKLEREKLEREQPPC
jgi:hypothetical protein